jgi:hypothetical protein
MADLALTRSSNKTNPSELSGELDRDEEEDVNFEISEEWYFTVLLPDVLAQQERLGYGGPVFLILNVFSGHSTEAIEEAFLQYGVVVIVLPPHSSDQTQPLDLSMFAIQKMDSHRVYAHLDLNSQTRKLVRTLYGWQRVTTQVNIISAFWEGGIAGEWSVAANALVCQVDRRAASQRRHRNRHKDRIHIADLVGERG